MRQCVQQVYDTVRRTVDHFVPVNLVIWDTLFPNWQQIMETVPVDFIVGFPQPYDAVVDFDPDGDRHIMFDLCRWTSYVGTYDVEVLLRDFLTHEMTHVFIGHTVPGIDASLECPDYLACLDANTFHEGFAHLISYEAQEIDTVNWHTPEFAQAYARCKQKMQQALAETDEAKQKENLLTAICGSYYDKFASICGMLHLVSCWEKGGVAALQAVLAEGYHGFAEKTIAGSYQ